VDFHVKAEAAIAAAIEANPAHASGDRHGQDPHTVRIGFDGISAFVPCSCGVTLAVRVEQDAVQVFPRVSVNDDGA
jgi:hypothetical protein